MVVSFWSSSATAFFGLRDFPTTGVDSLFSRLDPEEVHFAIVWQEIEPEDNQFDWTKVDSLISRMAENRGRFDFRDAVIQLDPASSWAMPNPGHAPYDTDWEPELGDPIPERGYSRSLYDLTSTLINHVYQRLRELEVGGFYQYPSVTVVLGSNINRTWIVADTLLDLDIEGYIRSLRTVSKAIVDFRERMPYYTLWGELDIASILEEQWLNQGDNDQTLRDSLLTLAQLFHERDSLRLESWEEFQAWVTSEPMQQTLVWAHRLTHEIASVDQVNFRYTFKPAFFTEVITSYERLIRDHFDGWRSTYSALEIQNGSLTQYSDSLLEVDYLRRWLNGRMSEMIGGRNNVCSPLLSDSANRTYGLLGVEGRQNRAFEVYQAAGNDNYANNPNRYSETGLIGEVTWVTLHDGAWDGGPQEFQTFLWINALTDSCTDTVSLEYLVGMNTSGVVLSMYGDTLQTFNGSESVMINVSTVPVQIFAYWWLDVNDGLTSLPSTFTINSAYPNPFNSSFTVEYSVSSPGEATLSLITLDGREVMRRELPARNPGEHRETFSLPDLPSGEYFVRMSSAGVVESKRVVLLR